MREGVAVLSDPEYLRNNHWILLVRPAFVARGRINCAVSCQTSTNSARSKSSNRCSGRILASARRTRKCVIKTCALTLKGLGSFSPLLLEGNLAGAAVESRLLANHRQLQQLRVTGVQLTLGCFSDNFWPFERFFKTWKQLLTRTKY